MEGVLVINLLDISKYIQMNYAFQYFLISFVRHLKASGQSTVMCSA